LTGRITETYVDVAIVTMVMMNICGETIFDAWMLESEFKLVLMGLRLRKYIELRVRLHAAGNV